MYIAGIKKTPLVKLHSDLKILDRWEPPKILDKFDLSHPWVQERIRYFARDTTEDILKNMAEFQVSPKRRDKNYTGNLERSIHWTIVSKAGGDMMLVEFYYLFYGKYLEISASGWLNDTYGPITPKMVPAMTDKTGVQVGKRPWKAKPFITSEIRRHAKKLGNRLAKQFAYAGGMKIFSTFVTENSLKNGQMSITEHSELFWKFINGEMKLKDTEVTLI